MASPTILGSRQIDPSVMERFNRGIATAAERLEQLSKAPKTMLAPGGAGGAYVRAGAGLADVPEYHGSFTRKTSSVQDYLAEQAKGQETVPLAGKSNLFSKFNLQASEAQKKAQEQFGDAHQFLSASGQGGMADKAMLGVRAAGGDPTAIAELVKQKVEDIQKRMSSAGQHALAGATSRTASGAASNALRGVGDLAGMGGGPIGQATEKILKFGAAVLESVEKLRNWGNSLHDANMQFAEFSGSMASVQARQEVRDIYLSRERGNRRAESAEDLAKAKNRMDRAIAPIDDAWNNLQNRVASWMLDNLAPVVEKLGEWLGLQAGENEGLEVTGENSWMGQSFNETWAEKQGRPKRFQ